MLSALTMITFGSLLTSSIAWFKEGKDINLGNGGAVNIDAGAEAAYYGGGDGSEDDPYIISNRNHLYNLAWLQYIGMYNVDNISSDSPSVSIQEKYFKITDDIYMDGIVLPPIGTETYPFFGHIDGGIYNTGGDLIGTRTIYNLVVSNDDPTQSTSDFGIHKPSTIPSHALQLNGSNQLTRVVGFVGVVGHIPTNTTITSNDYNSITPSITNIVLNNITTQGGTNSSPSQLLIGLAGGYVDGVLSGVKVSGDKSYIKVNNQTAVDSTKITKELSDYGLVGYATDDYKEYGGDYSQSIGQYYDSELEAQGKDNAWGGSVDMYNTFNRLVRMRTAAGNAHNEDISATYKKVDRNNDGDYNDTVNGQAESTRLSGQQISVRRYTKNTGSDYLGNFAFLNNDGNKIYMGGGLYETDEIYNTSTGFYITNGTHYLNSSLGDTTNTANLNNTYRWQFQQTGTSGTGYIRCYDETATGNQRPRYIYLRGASSYTTEVAALRTTTNQSDSGTTWTIRRDGTNLYIEINTKYRLAYTDSDGWALYDTTYTKAATVAHDNVYFNNNNTKNYVPQSITTTTNFYYGGTTISGVNPEQIYFNTLSNNSRVSFTIPGSSTTYYLYGQYANQRYYIVVSDNANLSTSTYKQMYCYTSGTNQCYIRTNETVGNNNYYVYLAVLSNKWGSDYWQNNNSATNSLLYKESIAASPAVSYSSFTLSDTLASDPVAAADIYKQTNDPYWNFDSTTTSYFPLNVAEKAGSYEDDQGNTVNYAVDEPTEKNTGYYVGGYTNQTTTVDNNRCITLTNYGSTGANYSTSGGKINKSFGSNSGGNSVYQNASLHDIKTIKSVASNGNPVVDDVNEDDYVRYGAASKRLQKILRGNSNVYGMHFVNKVANSGDIGMDAICRATNVSILGHRYPNYDLPVHSIDFNLQQEGYITFLSGIYSGGDSGSTNVDSFFSMHQVFRDPDDETKITAIKQIKKIYKNTASAVNGVEPDPYVYDYSDGSSSEGTKGDQVFDTSVIGKSNLTTTGSNYIGYIFYFEIPVNGGEYCLGNVSGAKEGCYLLYLDIGSNGKEVKDKIYSYTVTTVNSMQAYPLGVDFGISAAGNNGGDSMCIILSQSKTGTVSFAVSENAVTVGGATETVGTNTYSISKFAYRNCSVNAASGDPPPPQPSSGIEPTYTRKTYIKVVSSEVINNTNVTCFYYFLVVDNLDSNGNITTHEETITDPDTGDERTVVVKETDYYAYTIIPDPEDDDYDPDYEPNFNVLEIDYEDSSWDGPGGLTDLVPTLDEFVEGSTSVRLIDALRTRAVVAIIEKYSGKNIFDIYLDDMPWEMGTVTQTNPDTGESITLMDESTLVYNVTVVSEGTIVVQVTVTTKDVTSGSTTTTVLAYTVVVNGTTIEVVGEPTLINVTP